MQVLHVCSEMFPLLKTGGLADVIGALPAAQIADGVDARVLLPAFPDIRRGVTDAQVVSRRDTFAGHITLLFGHYNGVGIYLIDAPHLYDRPGSPYHDTNLFAYTDNVLRFALLGWVGAEMASGLDPFWRPDVVHAHDWHAGLAPAYLAARGRPAKSVFTVHNLAYQGMFYAHHMNDIQLPWSFFNIHGLEFNGQISFLKAGLYYADHITAVSPTYAREITEPQFAYGMEGLLQQRHREGRLSGVLNGVDEKIWSPETDLLLASRYTRDTLEDKAENKRQLQIAMGLKVDDKVPLFAVVSRLTSQKGLDLIQCVMDEICTDDVQLVVLGTGDENYENMFRHYDWKYHDRVSAQIYYSEPLSHKIYAACDAFLMPSLFEPCGLSQLMALRYGTVPIVRETGGLKDTVWPYNEFEGTGTGFSFANYNAHEMLNIIRYAKHIFYDKKREWNKIVDRAMAVDFSWNSSAKKYQELYDWLIGY